MLVTRYHLTWEKVFLMFEIILPEFQSLVYITKRLWTQVSCVGVSALFSDDEHESVSLAM
jgi:cytochrome c oxidase subunit IV